MAHASTHCGFCFARFEPPGVRRIFTSGAMRLVCDTAYLACEVEFSAPKNLRRMCKSPLPLPSPASAVRLFGDTALYVAQLISARIKCSDANCSAVLTFRATLQGFTSFFCIIQAGHCYLRLVDERHSKLVTKYGVVTMYMCLCSLLD
jgi:hypothetical protein